MFYPLKGDACISQWGPFVFTYVLFWGSKSLEHFKNLMGFSNFFFRQNVLFDGTDGRTGRTDGRTGRVDGPQKCPLIFFILRYIKHSTKGTVFFFPRKSLTPTHSLVFREFSFFFFSGFLEEKKTDVFFFFPGKVCKPLTRLRDGQPPKKGQKR